MSCDICHIEIDVEQRGLWRSLALSGTGEGWADGKGEAVGCDARASGYVGVYLAHDP